MQKKNAISPIRAWKLLIFFKLCLFLVIFGISCDGKSHQKQTSEKEVKKEEPIPKIQMLEEMQNWDSSFSLCSFSPDQNVQKKFQEQWNKMRDSVEKQITKDMVVNISRWAVEETKGMDLPSGWIQSLPMQAMGMSQDNKCILFSQQTEQGFPIPSHHSLVFRRLIVAAVYDTHSQTITQVIVTVRGWKEE